MTTSPYAERIADLADRAREERKSFEPPASPPAKERGLEYLREGFGPTVAVYLRGRTGDEHVRFSEVELSLLQAAINDWLALYLRCHGSSRDPAVTVREAAELLVETHNVRDTAQLLTGVPPRADR
ncbi:hypothetical protein ACFPM1_15570 [Halorubrum rubrum]|uniref:DUF8055 domain-containing protein n=1 Tax=Halorubrum rubrum TaxID=1126240 RepID=A0ABD5R6B9_9EURY|nr:hypothetical protein [Halorubrum rubrum]